MGKGDGLGEDAAQLAAAQVQVVDPLDEGLFARQRSDGLGGGDRRARRDAHRVREGSGGGVGDRHVKAAVGGRVKGSAHASPSARLGAGKAQGGGESRAGVGFLKGARLFKIVCGYQLVKDADVDIRTGNGGRDIAADGFGHGALLSVIFTP